MSTKQAACLNCRKSKIKCKRLPGAPACERCENSGSPCTIPSFHIGRQKGVKNKRTGLDKAIYQIEEAIKKSKAEASSDGTIQQLRQLLDEARGEQRSAKDPSVEERPSATDGRESGQSSDDHPVLDDAENPLQLLARASDLRLMMPQSVGPHVSTPSSGYFSNVQSETMDIHAFFQPIKARLDVGPELDPIDVGLLGLDEAQVLLTFFHEKLAHTRWGLDPMVHTLNFVRSQSAFLLTSLLLASSRFMPSASALAKRLLIHRNFLVQQVISKRFRSVEIVLAFMVNVPWMHPLDHAADDDTGVFISLALSIALDLSLNKIVVPSSSFHQSKLRGVARADCINATKALCMDGFEGVDSRSQWGERLLRRRERVWIALFVLERGVCLARGRNYSLQITPLIQRCDTWHEHPLADSQDSSLVSMAVLRRDLDDIFGAVRSRCDGYRVVDVGSQVAQEIEDMIDAFFSRWLAQWTSTLNQGGQNTLPPYVEILVTHTRLSTYSGVINHPTAPIEVKRQFRASALSSALNVMRAAIQGEASLMSMPNNTVIMICFAACVALNLSGAPGGRGGSLAPSVRNLIEETAGVLERIGSTPSHRNGASVLYGKYLRELVKQAPGFGGSGPIPDPTTAHLPTYDTDTSTVPMPEAEASLDRTIYQHQNAWEFQFSTMSSNQINESILSAGDFQSPLLDMPFNDPMSVNWMDWMDPSDFGFS